MRDNVKGSVGETARDQPLEMISRGVFSFCWSFPPKQVSSIVVSKGILLPQRGVLPKACQRNFSIPLTSEGKTLRSTSSIILRGNRFGPVPRRLVIFP